MNVSQKKKSKRIFYFDALRALAILCVILVHCVTLNKGFIYSAWNGPTVSWIISEILYNPGRIGVLLFLMLSGALSLGRQWDIKSFLGKRIPRIVYPFVFWNIIFISIFIILSGFNVIDVVESLNIGYLAHFVWGALTGDVYGFNPNWFFWMILGTYLIMPVFNRWLAGADLKEAEYFLVIWLVTCIFSFTLNMKFPIKLSYFLSPIGLVVAGYYLRYTERKFLNNPYLMLLVLIVTASISVYLGYLRSSPSNLACFNRYSIFNSIIAISVFLIFKNFSKFNININFKRVSALFRKMVFAMAKYSYGIYLIHYPIVFLFRRTLLANLPYSLLLTSCVLIALFVSMGVLAILNRVPYLNNIIGAK